METKKHMFFVYCELKHMDKAYINIYAIHSGFYNGLCTKRYGQYTVHVMKCTVHGTVFKKFFTITVLCENSADSRNDFCAMDNHKIWYPVK